MKNGEVIKTWSGIYFIVVNMKAMKPFSLNYGLHRLSSFAAIRWIEILLIRTILILRK